MRNTIASTPARNDPRTGPQPGPQQGPQPGPVGDAPDGATAHATGTAGDPRLRWSSTDGPAVPVLRFRRDGILPTIAAALSVRGETLTGTAGKADQPPVLHPLVKDFLDTLTSGQRERFTGRCPEAILLSRHLAAVEEGRSRRASRKPLTPNEARRSSSTPRSPPAASAKRATPCTAATHPLPLLRRHARPLRRPGRRPHRHRVRHREGLTPRR